MIPSMKLSELTSGQLTELTRLIAQKEKVLAELAAVEKKLARFGDGKAAAAKAGRPPKDKAKGQGRRGPRKGSKPGKLKQTVLETLQAAGVSGLSIQDLSKKLKVKTNNLYSWFYTTGKKVAGLKRAASGNYVYAAEKK